MKLRSFKVGQCRRCSFCLSGLLDNTYAAALFCTQSSGRLMPVTEFIEKDNTNPNCPLKNYVKDARNEIQISLEEIPKREEGIKHTGL